MSSSVDGGTLARMPSQEYGYSRSATRMQAGRHGIAADAVEPVAAGDGVAGDFMTGAPGVGEAEDRPFGIELSDLSVGDLELDHGPGREPGRIRSLTISVWA